MAPSIPFTQVKWHVSPVQRAAPSPQPSRPHRWAEGSLTSPEHNCRGNPRRLRWKFPWFSISVCVYKISLLSLKEKSHPFPSRNT